ncbi:LacI family DNA-binding transcriptional regulator [Kiloniella majae]|uniref:LacI family DNA-binding transcriptional regulator n=1 Tax=Kiloniella majae TaxID=1938558 RepID=UPI000A2780F2|nr:LacI family DNA-binding transcriptional regulator [Kiloniella majae]
MPTVRDVAKRAGVSVGTVSRVISNNAAVKQPLKERVLEAVAELGYKPNLAARALRTNRIDVIGLVVPDITNPFFAQLAKSIETEAAKRGHSVMLANSHDNAETERQQISTLLDRAPRGIIIVAANDSGELGFETTIPIVSLDRRFENYPLVTTDHSDGSAQIANHLYELGHREIAYIAGPQNTEVGRTRKSGFVSQIEKLCASSSRINLKIYEGQFDYNSGEVIARKILTQESCPRPTAIATASDQQAIGVLRAARDLNFNVPKDVAVTGFDDIALASLITPRLTTIRQPTEILATTALQYIFNDEVKPLQLNINGKIIVRGSTLTKK